MAKMNDNRVKFVTSNNKYHKNASKKYLKYYGSILQDHNLPIKNFKYILKKVKYGWGD
jgi:hypothetical protein